LKTQLKRLAQTASLDQLAARGIRRVRIARLDRIVELVQEAVRRSLGNGPGTPTTEALSAATGDQFLRLLHGQQDLQRSWEQAMLSKRIAEQEAAALRRELADSRHQLALQLAESERAVRASNDLQDAAISAGVDQLIADLGVADGGEARARIMGLVMNAVDHERAASTRTRQDAHARDVDLLERRIAKLLDNLRQTEAALGRAIGAGMSDDGIASIYRHVQGLDGGSPFADQKRLLMTDIFEANLKLQKPRAVAC
jgi:hypothetical protein